MARATPSFGEPISAEQVVTISSRHEEHAEEHGPLKQLRTALNVEGALLVQASTQLVSPLAQAAMHESTDVHVESLLQASSCEQQLESMHD